MKETEILVQEKASSKVSKGHPWVAKASQDELGAGPQLFFSHRGFQNIDRDSGGPKIDEG